MILQALTRYYEDLLSRGEIAAPGWAPAKISLALYINENGELTQIVPTMVEGTKGKKTVMQPQLMVLPAAVKRTVSIASNFLWDNSAYLLGIDQKGKPERSRECFAAAARLLFWVNDLTEFILQLPALRRVQQAFEHRILHALTVIDTFLCDSAQPPASGGVARVHIVGDQNQHRRLTSIKTADSRPSRRAGTARAAGFVHTVPDPTVSFPRETDA